RTRIVKAAHEIGSMLKDMQHRGHFAQDLDPYATGLMIDSLLKGLMIEWLIDPKHLQVQSVLQTLSRIGYRSHLIPIYLLFVILAALSFKGREKRALYKKTVIRKPVGCASS